MKVGLLSNERLPRGINWTTLADPLFAAMEGSGDCHRITPPPLSLGNLGALSTAMREGRRADALFSMHGRTRPEASLQLVSWAAGSKLKSVFYVDPWPHTLSKIRRLDSLLGHDLVFLPYREAYDMLAAQKGGERYRYLPFAADTAVFRPSGAERDVDIYWMGRRSEPLHRAIADFCEKEGLVYLFRENSGFIDNPADLGKLVARSRYFVVTPPDPSRSGGFSPLVMRYLEGLAAGSRLLGTLPASGEFEALLPREAILEVAADGSDFAAKYRADQDNSAGWKATRRATEIVQAEHGWDARARTILSELERCG